MEINPLDVAGLVRLTMEWFIVPNEFSPFISIIALGPNEKAAVGVEVNPVMVSVPLVTLTNE
jgi:hypothetical protein